MAWSLNSDGQQFHQYQQNEQSPLTSNHWISKNATTYGAGNQSMAWVKTHTCGRVKPANGIPISPW